MNLIKYNILANLLQFKDHLKIKKQGDTAYIYDIIRKKYLVLQPEELVRQLCIQWLIEDQGFSRNAIQVEKSIDINGLMRRFDIVVYDHEIDPLILVECKSPQTPINQIVFDQLASYQTVLHAPFLIVTNGSHLYISQMNHETQSYHFFESIPSWHR
ncbi:MAG: type I restriction enzyme HsdR N-terminal domain-containing protein [Chitinophagales bacterium]|nr:type I restriction enzyme HsdR N-terminal domain-containing protein [Chitinophagales bacterium]